jgi:hypothetical protein
MSGGTRAARQTSCGRVAGVPDTARAATRPVPSRLERVGRFRISESQSSRVRRLPVVGQDCFPGQRRAWAERRDEPDPNTAESVLPGPDSGGVNLADLLATAGRAELTLIGRSWGQSLARLHGRPVDASAPIAARPWILEAGRLAVAPELRRALVATADAWAVTSWVHGDARSKNTMARRPGRASWRSWSIDLEFGGLGDPIWDLACAYGSLARHSAVRRIDPKPLLRAFLWAYRSEGGTARLTPQALLVSAAWSIDRDSAEPPAPLAHAQTAGRLRAVRR